MNKDHTLEKLRLIKFPTKVLKIAQILEVEIETARVFVTKCRAMGYIYTVGKKEIWPTRELANNWRASSDYD